MKLIKLSHYRCGDFEKSTFLFAPDEKTEEDIENDIVECLNKLFENLKNKDLPALNYPSSRIDDLVKEYPNITLQEAAEKIKHAKKKYDEVLRKRREASRPFVDFMRDIGYKALWEIEEIEEYSVSYGHHHGLEIKYE